MKVAVVGAGSVGARHIRNLVALGVPAEDITAMDFRTDALDALPFGVAKVCCQPTDLLAETIGRPDALLICTPATHHQTFISHAQRSGIPFFVEKPAALSTETIFHWDYSGRHLVACNWRFRPEARRLYEAMRAVDDHYRIELVSMGDIRAWPGQRYASPIFEFCHEIDLALWVAPNLRWHRAEVWPDSARIEFIEARGGGSVAIAWRHRWFRSWSLSDADGTVFCDPPDDLNRMYVDEMAHFLRVVRGEEESVNTLAQARRVVEVCELVERTAVQ